MKLTILQEEFAKALTIASRFTTPKVQLPILNNILLDASKNTLHLSATNLEISISTSVGAEVEEDGKITIPAKTLTDIVSNLSKGKVELETEKETLHIRSKGFNSKITGMNAGDFPVIPRILGKESFALSSKDVINALSLSLFAVSVDESRPLLTGVLWLFSNKKLSFVATDGFRLSQIDIKAEVGEGSKIIVPKGILQEIIRLKETEEGRIQISYTKEENQLVCQVGNVVISSRLIEGEFPPFEKIIPKETNISITMGKGELLRAVKIASIFAKDSANVVKLKVGDLSNDEQGTLSVLAESSSKGNQATTINAEVSVRSGSSVTISDQRPATNNVPFTLAFNCKFLEDFLNAVTGEEVVIECVDEGTACIFKDPTLTNFLHIIMPIRLQS